MGVREAINRNPAVVGGIVICVLVIAVVLIIRGSTGGTVTEAAGVFYTVDDGQTYFRAPITSHPPFDHEGQEAVRAFVFTCGEGEPKVAYLMKYSDEARQKLIAADQNPEGDYTDALEGLPQQHILYKRPGEGSWVPGNDPRSATVRKPDCPPGVTARAVLP